MASRFSRYGKQKNDEKHPSNRANVIWQGCTNFGPGTRRIEAQVVGILNRKEQDWRLLCGSTPMTWNHTTFDAPTHCDKRVGYA